MVVYRCMCCNTELESEHQICEGCGGLICPKCKIKNRCVECYIDPNKLVYDYNKEKYSEMNI